MKKINEIKKYGSKAAVAVMVALPALASAEGIGDIGTTITAEVGKIVPIVTSAGTALLSVYLVIKAFRLVSGFLGGR